MDYALRHVKELDLDLIEQLKKRGHFGTLYTSFVLKDLYITPYIMKQVQLYYGILREVIAILEKSSSDNRASEICRRSDLLYTTDIAERIVNKDASKLIRFCIQTDDNIIEESAELFEEMLYIRKISLIYCVSDLPLPIFTLKALSECSLSVEQSHINRLSVYIPDTHIRYVSGLGVNINVDLDIRNSFVDVYYSGTPCIRRSSVNILNSSVKVTESYNSTMLCPPTLTEALLNYTLYAKTCKDGSCPAIGYYRRGDFKYDEESQAPYDITQDFKGCIRLILNKTGHERLNEKHIHKGGLIFNYLLEKVTPLSDIEFKIKLENESHMLYRKSAEVIIGHSNFVLEDKNTDLRLQIKSKSYDKILFPISSKQDTTSVDTVSHSTENSIIKGLFSTLDNILGIDNYIVHISNIHLFYKFKSSDLLLACYESFKNEFIQAESDESTGTLISYSLG